MKVIELIKGLVAIVDDEDFDRLAQYRWSLSGPIDKCYAVRRQASATVYMHKEIMPSPPGFVVDHINGNRLDNRRCNLRIATHKQNLRNTAVTKRNKLGVKGVWYSAKKKRYYADLRHNGKTLHLGTFRTLEDAKAAWNAESQRLYGEFSRLN